METAIPTLKQEDIKEEDEEENVFVTLDHCKIETDTPVPVCNEALHIIVVKVEEEEDCGYGILCRDVEEKDCFSAGTEFSMQSVSTMTTNNEVFETTLEATVKKEEDLQEGGDGPLKNDSGDSVSTVFLEGQDVVLDGQEVTELQHPPSQSTYVIPSTSRRKRKRRGTAKSPARGRVRGQGRARGPPREAAAGEGGRWNDIDVPDVTPTQPIFQPATTPGHKLVSTMNYSALDLFSLFFTKSILHVLVENTNEHGRVTQPLWEDITVEDLYSFLAIVIYMGIVKVPSLTDYWREESLYSLHFPKNVITGKRFLSISQALHISSARDDEINERKRGTTGFDKLCQIKPLYDHIRKACQSHYHPHQHIAIDERMVKSKARISLKQHMKKKPTKWGYKLFVMADSLNGYTCNLFVYGGKSNERVTGNGLSYDAVMRLLDLPLLGTGYKLYVDNFYTSPALFRGLLQKKVWACGTIRPHRVGYPKTQSNGLVPRSPRGTIKWIREDPLLFVQWRDTRDVFLCSTMHAAHGDDTVQRKVKNAQGQWGLNQIPLPPAVKDYNKHMDAVDLSDALIGYYDLLRKTRKWYKTLFLHFVDIAVVNSFLLHKCLCKDKGIVPMHQKAFRETLTLELSQAGTKEPVAEGSQPVPRPLPIHHRPVYISGHSTLGRQRCKECSALTPLKCATCDVALCLQPTRNCYNKWHTDRNM